MFRNAIHGVSRNATQQLCAGAQHTVAGFLFRGRFRPAVSTLVVCLYRGTPLDAELPIVGTAAVEHLVTTVGVDDPEDSSVNCLLEGLRVARDLDDEAIVSVLAGASETVTGDRAIAQQVDQLVAEYDPDSAIVVVDSAEDERLVPIVESRVPVDAVDRVVVRQARDIESTYYLLKQFLADEELRKTVLVPVGVALLAFPALLAVFDSLAVSTGAIAAVVGVFLLYKGLSVDAFLADLSSSIREALYSGQVSLVTYVVAGGLALVGVFVGLLGASSVDTDAELLVVMRLVHDSIPWLTGGALIASAGRLLDEFIRDDDLGSAYINLPFVAISVGLAIRGFGAYFLQRSGVASQRVIPRMEFGPVGVDEFVLAPGTHLAIFILASIVVSLVGVRVAAYVSSAEYEMGYDERSS
jgi:putative membrane protein